MFNCTTFHSYMYAVLAGLICTTSSVGLNTDNSRHFCLKLFILLSTANFCTNFAKICCNYCSCWCWHMGHKVWCLSQLDSIVW